MCLFLPGSFVTKVKRINSQSDLILMSNFAGPSYFIIRTSVHIILIRDPCIFNLYNLCQTVSKILHRMSPCAPVSERSRQNHLVY